MTSSYISPLPSPHVQLDVIFNTPDSSIWTRSAPVSLAPLPNPSEKTSAPTPLENSDILVPPNISTVLQNPTQTFSSIQLIAKSAESSAPTNFPPVDLPKGPGSVLPIDINTLIKPATPIPPNQAQSSGPPIISTSNPLKRKRQLTSEDIKENHKNREKRRRDEVRLAFSFCFPIF